MRSNIMKSARILFLLLVSILFLSCETVKSAYSWKEIEAVRDSEIVKLENVTLDGEHSIMLQMGDPKNHRVLKNHIIRITVFHDENLDEEIFKRFDPNAPEPGISYGFIYAKTDKHGWLKVQNIRGYENFILED